MELKIECPMCKKAGAIIDYIEYDIPHFGKAMESVLICPECKYRHVDIISLEERDPVLYQLEIDSPRDMHIRIVRSSWGAVQVPELGISVEPGDESEGYISNVEGVFQRIRDAVNMAKGWSDNEGKRRADELLGKIDKIIQGDMKATLIIRDHSGNSAIISEKAKKEPLK